MSAPSETATAMLGDALADQGPFKGQQSYQTEDAEFFHGRERDGIQLTSRILSTRMTVVYAASGAGKTSLLNALVIPSLEAHDWTPIYTRPQENPLVAIRLATIRTLLPPLEQELAALHRAMEKLGCTVTMSLSDLLRRYDETNARTRRLLITPLPTASSWTFQGVALGDVVPYVVRLLRRSIEFRSLWNHLTAIERGGQPAGREVEDSGDERTAWTLPDSVTLGEITARLDDDALKAAYGRLLSRLEVPVPELSPFFEYVLEVYGNHVPHFGLVLMVDQFEELFTLFVERRDPSASGSSSHRDWRLRPRLLKEIEALHTAQKAGADGGREQRQPPMRFVISLREEYVAHLDPIRLFAPEINETAYRLGLLSAADARVAIQRPIKLYTDEQGSQSTKVPLTAVTVDQIVAALAREDGHLIAPSELQIVCDRYWRDPRTRETARRAATTGDVTDRQWVRDILGSFLDEVLNEIARACVDPKKPLLELTADPSRDSERVSQMIRHELLDLLSMLITNAHRRNIVEEPQLVHAPFRKEQWRRTLLQLLTESKLVRRERRLDSDFYEVTHEFLIDSIEKEMSRALRADQLGYGRLALAVSSLTAAVSSGSLSLSPEAFRALQANAERLDLNAWAKAVMFRSSIIAGDWRAMGPLGRAYADTEVRSARALCESLLSGQTLLPDEVLALYADRDDVMAHVRKSPELAEALLRASLTSSHPQARDTIQFWARRLADGNA